MSHNWRTMRSLYFLFNLLTAVCNNDMTIQLTDFKSSVFEFYGHGGVGFLVNVLTDNDNRAFKDISFVAKGRNIKQAAANSVAFKFDTKARLSVQSVIDEVSVSCSNSPIKCH